MSLQDEMQQAAEEYARRLDQDCEAQRLAALRLEAQKHSNADAFAEFFEAALDQQDTDQDTQETP